MLQMLTGAIHIISAYAGGSQYTKTVQLKAFGTLCEACSGTGSAPHCEPSYCHCVLCLLYSLSHKMVVSEVLGAAKALVYKYCELSVKKGFHLLNGE